MSTLAFNNKPVPHSITLSVAHGIDVFSQECYKDVFIEMLNFCIAKRGLNLHAWSIMGDHVDLIISARKGCELEKIISDLKKYTAKIILISIHANFKELRKDWMLKMFKWEGLKSGNDESYDFWEEDNRLMALKNSEILAVKLNSLHERPVVEGVVWQADQYKYSSATDYYEEKAGLLPVNMLSLKFPETSNRFKYAV